MPFYGVPKTANFAATSGSNAGVYKLFFQAEARFLLVTKEMGLYLYEAGRIISAPTANEQIFRYKTQRS